MAIPAGTGQASDLVALAVRYEHFATCRSVIRYLVHGNPNTAGYISMINLSCRKQYNVKLSTSVALSSHLWASGLLG